MGIEALARKSQRRLGIAIALGVSLGFSLVMVGCVKLRRSEYEASKLREPEPSKYRVIVQGPRISNRSLAAVDVVNARGPVRIIVDPNLLRPTVDARPLPDFAASVDDIDALHEGMAVTAESIIDTWRNVLRVRAAYLNTGENARIELTVRIPSCGGVLIRNADGNVELIGVTGDINVHSGVLNQAPGGNISIITERKMEGPLKLATTSGDIDLIMPPTSTGDFEVSSMDGRVTMQLEGGQVSGVKTASTRWTGLINQGIHFCQVETMKGNVRIRMVDQPVEHQARMGMAP